MRAKAMKYFGLLALLGIMTSGCVGMPAGTMVGWDAMPNSLVGSSPRGGGGNPQTEVNGATSALFQTSVGPVAWKGVQLARMLTAGPSLLWNAPPDNYNQAIAVPKEGFGWAVGYGIARYEVGWNTEQTDVDSLASPLVASAQRIRLTDVSFASGSVAVGYAVGTRGTILKYDSPNKRWTKILGDPASGQSLGTVKVLAANDVWVAGQVLLHWNGVDWIKYPELGPVSGLAVVNPNNLWASTGSGLYQWDGTAKTWTARFTPVGHTVGAPQIAAFGTTIVGLAIEPGVPSGAVFMLKDGAWQTETVTVPEDVGLDSVVIANPTTAYAKTYDNSGVYRFDLPTKTWSYYSE